MIHFSLPQWIWILEIALSVINVILALVIIFIERKNPAKTLAWILVLFFLPIAVSYTHLCGAYLPAS